MQSNRESSFAICLTKSIENDFQLECNWFFIVCNCVNASFMPIDHVWMQHRQPLAVDIFSFLLQTELNHCLRIFQHSFPADFYSIALPYYPEFVIISFLLFGISVGVQRSLEAKQNRSEQMDNFWHCSMHCMLGLLDDPLSKWIAFNEVFLFSFILSAFAFRRENATVQHKRNETEEVKIVLFVANWFLSVPNANCLLDWERDNAPGFLEFHLNSDVQSNVFLLSECYSPRDNGQP